MGGRALPYITFIRHGKSIVDGPKIVMGACRHTWIDDCNRAGTHVRGGKADALREILKGDPVVLASNLKRAEETAVHLFGPERMKRDAIFREADLPDPPRLFSSVRLPASGWCAVMRVLWLCGYSRHAEPVGKTRERARAAAERLIELSVGHVHTVLVGHGFFNRMIAAVLQENGWMAESRHSNKNWGITTYTKAR